MIVHYSSPLLPKGVTNYNHCNHDDFSVPHNPILSISPASLPQGLDQIRGKKQKNNKQRGGAGDGGLFRRGGAELAGAAARSKAEGVVPCLRLLEIGWAKPNQKGLVWIYGLS